MRISISNLSWDVSREAEVFDLLRRKEVYSIEIAPTKYFPSLENVTENDAEDLKKAMTKEGMSVHAFQALLYSKPDLTIFDDSDRRDATLKYLLQVGRIASWVGASKLVFGAPKNRRVPDGMNTDTALAIATEFFRKIAFHYQQMGVVMCIEPNPKEYSCNFGVRTSEAAGLVRAVESPAFRLLLDSGTMAMNDEDPYKAVQAHSELVEHVHAGEPKLMPVGFDETSHHKTLAKALADKGYSGFVAVEMLPPPNGLADIERSLDFAIKTYGYIET